MATLNTNKHHLAGKRIIVTGGGLAGLTFASALEKYRPNDHPRPELVVYERSAQELDLKKKGYTMSIKPTSGLLALQELGLLNTALQNSTVGQNGIQPLPTLWTRAWKPMFDPNTPAKMKAAKEQRIPSTGIRLVRHVLRDMLLDVVPDHVEIHWQTGCDTVSVLEDGRIRVTLSDGSTDECDLLIAADGANSRVRSSLLPDETLNYAGAICFMGTSRFPTGKPEPLKQNWGMTLSGTGVPFLTFPVDHNTAIWGLTYQADQARERIRGDEIIARKEQIFAEIKERGKALHNPFSEVVEATDLSTLQIFSAMDKQPIEHGRKLLRNENVIFIGDANHPMSPFSGNGANMALKDGVELTKQLCSSASLRAAVDQFDAESIPRSKKAIDRGRWTIAVLHARGIAFLFVRAFLWLVNLWMHRKA